MICGPLSCAIANDLDRPSSSLKLLFSENKCSLLFRSLIESAGDLAKDDIACNLEWPLKVTSTTVNGFVVSIAKV